MNFGDVRALVFQRGWLTLSGAATLLIVPQTLTKPEQGLFFTFLSLAAIQSIFEAGITSVFFNYTAYERALLACDPPPSNIDRARAEARLRILVVIARRWFISLAVMFCVLVGSFGYHFLDTIIRREDLTLHWQTPFLLLIGAISLSLFNLSRIPIIEGYGHIADVANIRLRSSMLSAAVLWVGMLIGFGLWALAVSYTVQNLIMAIQVAGAHRRLALPTEATASSAIGEVLNWRTEILPLQLRLAGSYFCGYFIAQGVVPYTLQAHGSETAGQIGLMLSVFNALATIVASYMYAAAPSYAANIARQESKLLASRFANVTFVTLTVAIGAYALVLAFVYAVHRSDFAISHRIAAPSVVFWMATIGLVNAYVGSAATLLRAQRREPMLLVSVVVAVGYVSAMMTLSEASIEDLFMVFAAVQLGFALPLTMWLLRKSALLRVPASA